MIAVDEERQRREDDQRKRDEREQEAALVTFDFADDIFRAGNRANDYRFGLRRA